MEEAFYGQTGPATEGVRHNVKQPERNRSNVLRDYRHVIN